MGYGKFKVHKRIRQGSDQEFLSSAHGSAVSRRVSAPQTCKDTDSLDEFSESRLGSLRGRKRNQGLGHGQCPAPTAYQSSSLQRHMSFQPALEVKRAIVKVLLNTQG